MLKTSVAFVICNETDNIFSKRYDLKIMSARVCVCVCVHVRSLVFVGIACCLLLKVILSQDSIYGVRSSSQCVQQIL